MQLWVAQPDATRSGAAAIEHHAELPRVELANGDATVLVGEMSGVTSPSRRDTDHLGVDLDLRSGRSSLPLGPAQEYTLAVLDGAVMVAGHELVSGRLGYLGTGHDELVLDASAPVRVLLIGGDPFPEEVLMWWNYVARTREEITAAHRSWINDDGRFGTVVSPLGRVLTGEPPWVD